MRIQVDLLGEIRMGVLFVIDIHAFHTATRRLSLEYIAAKVLLRELLGPLIGPRFHLLRVIDARICSNEPHIPIDVDKTQRFPWDAETDLHFRAYRNPLHVSAEYLRKESVALMAAVEANVLAEQTR